MYSEILIRTMFKDFHIMPTADNKITFHKKDFSARVNGFADKATPFDAYFYFKDGAEWQMFQSECKNKMLMYGKWESDKVKESVVVRDKKHKDAKTPYDKWVFYGVKKLY